MAGDTTRKAGRTATGSGTPVQARFQPKQLAALDRYAASEGINRPKAIRAILADWLRTHGFSGADAVEPIGPATDAVEAMDAAIKEHRTKRKR